MLSIYFIFVFCIFVMAQDDLDNQIITFIDDKGIYRIIDPKDSTRSTATFENDVNVLFYLITQKNPTNHQEIKKGDLNSLLTTHFDISKQIKIVIHGWNGDKVGGINSAVGPAFLDAMDVNVIVIDWSKGAHVNYFQAIKNVPIVGAKVADFIDWLNSFGVPYSNFHIIGHSLGAHVAGFSGRLAHGVVQYITGLDPANPGWGATSNRLNRSDAEYVEVIHTNCLQLGLWEPIGHNDFYPNGGIGMVGCERDTYCSHTRSFEYFAESIDNEKFLGQRCRDMTEIVRNTCANLSQLYMGGTKIKKGNGDIYFLETNAKRPFYKN